MRKTSPNPKSKRDSHNGGPVGVESTIQPIIVTQRRLAHIHELEAQDLRDERDRPLRRALLRKEKAQVRRLLLRNATVEEGNLTAVLYGPKKRLLIS